MVKTLIGFFQTAYMREATTTSRLLLLLERRRPLGSHLGKLASCCTMPRLSLIPSSQVLQRITTALCNDHVPTSPQVTLRGQPRIVGSLPYEYPANRTYESPYAWLRIGC